VAELVPARLAAKKLNPSKATGLIADQPTPPFPHPKIALPRKATLGAAFRRSAAPCCTTSQANEPAVLAGLPEGCTRCEWACAALRAAIWVFSDLLHCQQTETIKQDLKLAGRQARARCAISTCSSNTKVKRLAAAEPPIAGLADLVGELDYRRAVAAEAAKAAIASSALSPSHS